jgi:asparagine synthase (glutamine-hydrolysing)
MCGIAGFYGEDAADRTAWMTRWLAHRGPDEEGTWVSSRHPFALGNRRLRILDLSPSGHQPMRSEDGRWALTFNGEIYNYLELREGLESRGRTFQSHTDTEVLFAALQEWGSKAVERVSGMFAFALWDDQEGRLLLGRDRLGIKPLYYAKVRGSICFASEISALLASGLIEPRMDPRALESYLRLLWVPEPRTLFTGVTKLEPGHTLTWDRAGTAVRQYWDVPLPGPDIHEDRDGARERVLESLQGAIKRQLRADVPVGAFLSGGIDSTAILSLAVGSGTRTVRTYSIGFASADRAGEGALDDLRFAKFAAAEFGVPHQEIILAPDVVDLFPKMVRHLEDPVADPAALNCYLICLAARETSTVLLSGTGGDELFGGYRKYTAESLAARYHRIPAPVRSALLEPLVRSLPIAFGRTGFRPVRFAKKFLRHADASMFDRFLGYSSYYDASELEELLGGDPGADLDPDVGVTSLREAWDRRNGGQTIDRMTYVDLKYYLPGLGLAYMDKASMAASVEVRVPLIDDDVVDVVARLPDSMKVRGLRTKVILREVMKNRIPDRILRRPKAPFAAPLRTWLRRDLKGLIGDYLSPGRVLARGILNPGVVHRMIQEHQQGREDHSLRIWALLTLEVWIQEFYDNRARFKMPDRIPELEMAATENTL